MEQDQDCPHLLSPFFELPSPFFPALPDADMCFFQDPSAAHSDAPLEDSFIHLLGAPPKPAPASDEVLALAISPPPAPALPDLAFPVDEPDMEDEDESAGPSAKELDPDGAFVEDLTRQWTTVMIDRKVMGEADVVIKCKTRLEDAILSLPKKLYSSLKYEVKQHTTGPLAAAPTFLLARAFVLDAESLEEVKKESKPALKGTIESALTKSPAKGSAGLEGSLRLQFNIVSYHLERASFVWEIRYFTPENLETPCLIKRSAPFKVFARKPKKMAEAKRAAAAKPKGKKRALEGGEERPAKRSKSTGSSFAEFASKLDDLVKCNSSLPEHERELAMQLVVSKFISLQHIAPAPVAVDSSATHSVFMTSLFSALSPPASFQSHSHT